MGCHFLLQGIFLTQGSNPVSLKSPALAGGFFTTSATWEALYVCVCVCIHTHIYTHHVFCIHSSISGHLGCFSNPSHLNIDLCLLNPTTPPCARLGFPTLYQCPGSTSKQKLGWLQGPLHSFPCPQGSRFCVSSFHCVKAACIFSSFLIVYSRKASLVPLTLSWPEVEFQSFLLTFACN